MAWARFLICPCPCPSLEAMSRDLSVVTRPRLSQLQANQERALADHGGKHSPQEALSAAPAVLRGA